MPTTQTPVDWTTLVAEAGATTDIAATAWRPCGSFSLARLDFGLSNNTDTTNASVVGLLQFTNEPDGFVSTNVTPLPMGSTVSTVGHHYPDDFTDVSTNAQKFQLARLAWRVDNTQGGARAFLRVGGGVLEIITS